MEYAHVRYAHTFLFACPNCDFPVATSRIDEQKNLEPLEVEIFRVACDHCDEVSNLTGVLAKTHFVTQWLGA